MHRRVRSSIDSDRAVEVKHPAQLASRTDATSTSQHVNAPTSLRSRRLESFRETTRAKLASFSGFAKDHPDPSIRLTPRSHVRPVPLRSSSLARGTADDKESEKDENPAVVIPEVVTPTSLDVYAQSVTSTQSSNSRRERVMGHRADQMEQSVATVGKVFVPQKRSDVLPFAADHPFAAWDPTEGAKPKPNRRPSVNLGPMMASEEVQEDWKASPKGKRGWTGNVGVYRVGWEREILDLEARVHEAMWEIEDSHTLTQFPSGREPETVLDIGTGTGLWPISQALVWPQTVFIGMDIVPVQTELGVLARAERYARSSSDATADEEGIWESIKRRVKWDRADILQGLPYDAGVFDMVHIRFCGLGIPESKWGDVIEEAARVLKRGGTLEIVEMAYTLNDSTPTTIKNAFASILQSEMVSSSPNLPIQFHLPLSDSLVPTYRTVYERTWYHPTLSEAAMIWVKSALEYEGTGLKRSSLGRKVLHALGRYDERWITLGEVDEEETKSIVWAWNMERQ